MRDLREAFLKLSTDNPDSPISGIIIDVDRLQQQEDDDLKRKNKRKENLDRLGGQFEWFGRIGLEYVNGNAIKNKTRVEWREILPLLANTEEDDRPELIAMLAKGLMLTEDLNSSYQGIASQILNKTPFSSNRFSTSSKILFEVVSGISGYSKTEQISFRDFMYARSDLRGSVALHQTFPAVAEWLVQSRNTSQSSRLS